MRHLTILISIVFAAIILYLPIQKFDFVNLDDSEYVYENPNIITGISAKNIQWAFTTSYSCNWHPFTWISHMVDASIFHTNAGGHHITNLIFHIANIFFLFLLIRKLLQDNLIALIASSLFALHPINVESVAWIAERKNLLSTLFFLSTLIFWCKFTETHKKQFYGFAIAAFCAGLLSKSMVVTTPAILMLIAAYKNPSKFSLNKNNALIKITNFIKLYFPFFLLSLIISLITLYSQTEDGAHWAPSIIFRIQNALVSYCTYIRQLIIPIDLTCFYSLPKHYSLAKVIASITSLVGVSVFALYLWIKNKGKAFLLGWSWYLITCLPIIGIIRVGWQEHADRYMYVPAIGIFIIIGASIRFLYNRFNRNIFVLIFLSICLCWYSFLTTRQVSAWKNSKTLFMQNVGTSGPSSYAYNSVGVYWSSKNIYDSAQSYYQAALRIDSCYALAYCNLGCMFWNKGVLDSADLYLKKAHALEPYNISIIQSVTDYAIQNKQLKFAEELLYKVIRNQPKYPHFYFSMAQIFYEKKLYDSSVCYLNIYEQKRLSDFKSIFLRANIFYLQNNYDKSIEYLNKSIVLDTNNFFAYTLLGKALYKKKNFSAAEKSLNYSLQVMPTSEAFLARGIVHSATNKKSESISDFQQAIALDSHNLLAIKYYKLSKESIK